ERVGVPSSPWGNDPKRRNHLLGALMRPLPVDPWPAGEGPVRLMAEHCVLPQGRGQEQTALGPILGDIADARLPPFSSAPASDLLVAQSDGPFVGRPKAHQGFDQLPLAVSLDAGNPNDLPAVDLEADSVEQGSSPVTPNSEV